MKAMQAMLYLLIFNLVITIIAGLEIYNIGSISQYNYDTLIKGNADLGTIFFLTAEIWGTLIAGGIAGAVAAILQIKIKTSAAAAYAGFASLLTVVFLKATTIFANIIMSITNQVARGAVTIFIVIFLSITGLMFVIGYIQMVRGGFESSM